MTVLQFPNPPPCAFDLDLCATLMQDFSEAIIARSKRPGDIESFRLRPVETMEALLRTFMGILDLMPSMQNPKTRRELAVAVYEDMMASVDKPPMQS